MTRPCSGLLLAGLLATISSSAALGRISVSQAANTANKVAPLVDYHVHLLGPYALPLEPSLSPVVVPADLQLLLDRRAALYGKSPSIAALDEVFTPDALLLDDVILQRWMNDRDEFASFLGLFEGWSGARLVAHRVSTAGTTSYVAGTVRTGDGTIMRNFLLALKRSPRGGWKIAAESTTAKRPPPYTEPITADRIIASMDKGSIRRALVLSEAFWVGGATSEKVKRLKPASSKVAAVRLENDWAAAQVARYPGRLFLACGLNPLEDHAIAEMQRCAGQLRAVAAKINVGGGGDNIDLHDAAQVQRLKAFFAAADRIRMPIIVHLGSRSGFGRAEVRIFLDRVMSAAPNIPVQIAHMSNGFQQPDALREFADARAASHPMARNLYFDLSVGSFNNLSPALGAFLADMIRKIGLENVLYASDELPGDQHAPTWKHWQEIRDHLPLTDAEFEAIADNVTPYVQPR